MSKNKRKNKKIQKKTSDTTNGVKNGYSNGHNKDILDDVSVKKVTVTMESPNGSTITKTEKRSQNGTIENGSHQKKTANSEKQYQQIHKDKNDYLETNIEKFDDKEIKSVIRTTKNSDGTITKKKTVVTSYPDGRLETNHTEETIDPNEINKEALSDKNSNNEENTSDQIDLDNEIEESSLDSKDSDSHIKIDKSNLTQILIQNKEPYYSELPSILSALPDYLVVIKSNENLNNKSYVKVPSANLESGVFYNSNKYEIMSKEEINNFRKLVDENKDLGSEIMSKHVHLLNYYGNVSIEKLKESLMANLNHRNIHLRETDLEQCLNAIDHNLDGEINYIEFVDFFCLLFSTRNTIEKNLLSILNEHHTSHSQNGYLSADEARKFFTFLKKFYAFEDTAEFPRQISYDAFIAKCMPFVENKLYIS